MSKSERIGIRFTKEEREWLEEKVSKGEFASLSHGVRRCVNIVRKMEEDKTK